MTAELHYSPDTEGTRNHMHYVHPPVDAEPTFAVVEIIETGDEFDPNVPVIIPNEVRINGQSLYTSAEHPIRVESVEIAGAGNSLVEVTLTLIARRVTIAHESEVAK